uniref:Uncharacterized protein n=1 Tax=Anguilla anguilla TaxID=7936 RepID=A0A0E9WKP4_ANGAN
MLAAIFPPRFVVLPAVQTVSGTVSSGLEPHQGFFSLVIPCADN